jgi:hypothetical protein
MAKKKQVLKPVPLETVKEEEYKMLLSPYFREFYKLLDYYNAKIHEQSNKLLAIDSQKV